MDKCSEREQVINRVIVNPRKIGAISFDERHMRSSKTTLTSSSNSE
jgi:hypothetical protein